MFENKQVQKHYKRRFWSTEKKDRFPGCKHQCDKWTDRRSFGKERINT